MTILSAQTIRRLKLLDPMVERQQHPESGCSFGLSACGYDLRLDQDIVIEPGGFTLASTMERFHMPTDVVGIIHDKSTWARRGIAVQNTVAEPGWSGFLTLEISCNIPVNRQMWEKFWPGTEYTRTKLVAGTPIAQVIFHRLDEPTEQAYPDTGKYQNQERGPVAAKSGVGHG